MISLPVINTRGCREYNKVTNIFPMTKKDQDIRHQIETLTPYSYQYKSSSSLVKIMITHSCRDVTWPVF